MPKEKDGRVYRGSDSHIYCLGLFIQVIICRL